MQKSFDWLQRCSLQLPRGTANTPLSLRKRECEKEWVKASAYLLLAKWLCSLLPLSCSPFFKKKKRNTCTVRAPKYEIQFSFPQTVFLLKPLLSRLADSPGQLSSTRLWAYVLYKLGRRTSDIERLREREGRHRVWTRHQRIETVCSKTTEGLNLPERQLSLLCNLTRTCLTWAWFSTPARPSAPNQFHIGHRENYSSDLFVWIIFHRCNRLICNNDINSCSLIIRGSVPRMFCRLIWSQGTEMWYFTII